MSDPVPNPGDIITTRLFGGAGNQLFQYASARALADHIGCDLALDSRYVAGNQDRSDCFTHFQNARIRRDIALPPSKNNALRYAMWRALGSNPRFYRERNLGHSPDFFQLKSGTYLHGYWQSEKYFAAIQTQIRKDLAFTTPLDAANAAIAEQIRATPISIALHVRRGDYVNTGSYAACTPVYYREGAAYIAARSSEPIKCFVFSNDPQWANDNLALAYDTTIVDINTEATGHFDMHLMSLCDHNVIANSTFSWWGAWLNTNPDKIVVAPKTWFATDTLKNPDLLPSEWAQV